jgi:uncharacterized membrane protein (UPF0182 family)
MESQQVQSQARMYVYDLMNEAREHGFKSEDKWNIALATEADRVRMQKEYYPVVANKVPQSTLLDVFQFIKATLKQSLSTEELQMDSQSVQRNEQQYIVAFNPKRLR